MCNRREEAWVPRRDLDSEGPHIHGRNEVTHAKRRRGAGCDERVRACSAASGSSNVTGVAAEGWFTLSRKKTVVARDDGQWLASVALKALDGERASPSVALKACSGFIREGARGSRAAAA